MMMRKKKNYYEISYIILKIPDSCKNY
jgi:hypothetical protein